MLAAKSMLGVRLKVLRVMPIKLVSHRQVGLVVVLLPVVVDECWRIMKKTRRKKRKSWWLLCRMATALMLLLSFKTSTGILYWLNWNWHFY